MASSSPTNDIVMEMEMEEMDVSESENKIPDDVEFGRKLGEGSFGKVFLVKGFDGVCVKRIMKQSKQEWEGQKTEARKEFEVLKKLSGEYFVSVYELKLQSHRLLIFMEFMPGGTLHRLIRDSPGHRLSDEFQVIMFGCQLLYAIQHMHKSNVMNRDLKPENILLDSTKRHLKICDFGLAKELSSKRTHTALSSNCGTSRYMAPEIDRGEYGSQSELWSLGIILVEMNTGVTTPINLDNLLRGVSNKMKDLISKLLVHDPKGRLTATKALEHDLFNEIKYDNNDDLDAIINVALDYKFPIYAVVLESEYIDGECKNTGTYYIPNLCKVIIVNDQRLSACLFPVTKRISGDIIVASNVLNSFLTFAKGRREFASEDNYQRVHVIVSQSYSTGFPDPNYYNVGANGQTKVKLSDLYLHIKDKWDPPTLSAIVEYIAANVKVNNGLKSTLSLSCSPSQPIANLCEAIREMDGGLEFLDLIAIDLSGEKRLADTLKGMKKVHSLTLNSTSISDDALVQIGHKVKHKLHTFNLSLYIHNEPCLKSPDTCARFFNAIKHKPISALWLTKNKLTANHLSALPDILPTMKHLHAIKLDDFDGRTEFMNKLSKAIGTKIASILDFTGNKWLSF